MSEANEDRILKNCFLCGSKYQLGPHRYDGKFVPRYKFAVCMRCYKGNWDGWAPHYEDKIIDHLNNNAIPIPERNDKGWLPRD
jgi:hypothetical protein